MVGRVKNSNGGAAAFSDGSRSEEKVSLAQNSSPSILPKKQGGRKQRTSLQLWQGLSTFWKKIVCLSVFLLMAIVAALVIVLVIFVRPRGHAADTSYRPPPIAGNGQTDNTTTSEFSSPPVRLALLTNFPDPALHYDAKSKTWYVFGTNQAAGILNLDRSTSDLSLLSLGNIQMATSQDFQTWKLVDSSSEPLPHAGRWTRNGTTDISSLPYHDDGKKRNTSDSSTKITLPVPKANVWAPELLHRPSDGKWVLYYAATNGTGGIHCIGAAIGSSPAGPFTAGGAPIICPGRIGGVIDPTVFVDESDNNALYLAYKVDGNGRGHGGECNNMKDPRVPTPIMLQRMQDDGVTPKPGFDALQLLDRTKEDGPLVEAPVLVKAGDYYFLFYSSGCTRQPDYDLRYATATRLTGPYERHEPALVQTKDFRLTAPGSASIRHVGEGSNSGAEGTTGPSGSEWRLALHGRINTTIGGVRALFTAGLDFDGKDVKVVDASVT